MRQAAEIGDAALRFIPGNTLCTGGGESGLGVELIVLAGDVQVEELSVLAAEENHLRLRGSREDKALRTFFVKNRKVRRLLVLDECSLSRDVMIERAVAIEMVRRDHRHHRDVRRPIHLLQILEHEAGDFQNDLVFALDVG